MNTIHDLDQALRDLERHAPDAGEMHKRLAGQLATRPRAARTARLAICAAAAVVIAIAILAITLTAGGGRSHPIRPGEHSSPVQTVPTSPSPTAPSRPSTATPVSSFALDWRFRVTPVPGYTITREMITATDQQARVSLTAANKDIGGIDVYGPGIVPSDLAILDRGRQVSVHGAEGYFAVTGQSSALVWRVAPDSWAEVSGDWGYDTGSASGTQQVDPTVARTGELKIAEAVTVGIQDPLRTDFTVGYLPPGLHLQRTVFYAKFDSGQPLCELDFVDNTPGQSTPDGPSPALTITRTALATDTGQPGNTAFAANTRIAGRPAQYSSGFLGVRYPDHSELDIAVDAKHISRYTKKDLITIAEHAAPAGSPAHPSTWATGNSVLPR